MMAALPSWRTVASSGLVAIVASFQVHNEFDGVSFLIHRHVHLVDHLLDQEQAPAARSLRPGQLGFQVWHVRLRDRLAPALVGDAHRYRPIGPAHDEIPRPLRAEFVSLPPRFPRPSAPPPPPPPPPRPPA